MLKLQETKLNYSKSAATMSVQQERLFTDVATYKGVMVALEETKDRVLQLTREIRIGFTEVCCRVPWMSIAFINPLQADVAV